MKKLLASLILLSMVINILPAASSISDGVSIEYIPPAYSLGIGKSPTVKLEVNGDVLVNETLAYDSLVNNTIVSNASTINWGLGNRQKITLNVATTALTFSVPPGVAHLTLFIYQDATGGRLINWTPTPGIRWVGGITPTLTTTASRLDIITCIYDGTSRYYCQAGLNFTPA